MNLQSKGKLASNVYWLQQIERFLCEGDYPVLPIHQSEVCG